MSVENIELHKKAWRIEAPSGAVARAMDTFYNLAKVLPRRGYTIITYPDVEGGEASLAPQYEAKKLEVYYNGYFPEKELNFLRSLIEDEKETTVK